MKKLKLLGLSLCLTLCLAGCSVLTGIADWLPFGISVFDSVVAIVAPANVVLAADAASGQKIFNDLDAAVAVAKASGVGKTGLTRVIAEISSVVQSQQQVLADLAKVGAPMNAQDLGYVKSGESLLIAALQGFQAELQAQSGNVTPPVQSAVEGSCFGFEPATKDHGPHVWASCDPSDLIDYTWDRDPQTGSLVPAGAKAPKLGSFKRQFNALARKYGRTNKQLRLTMAEHLHLR